jgi:hypothetical protein
MDSGFGASRRPGMTFDKKDAASAALFAFA